MPSILADVFCILGKIPDLAEKCLIYRFSVCNRLIYLNVYLTDIETSALEEKNRRDHYTQLVGACLVRTTQQKPHI